MGRKGLEIARVAALGATLAACASGGAPAPGGGVYKVGNPYQIAGAWYYPREQPDYDETGIGSWYGAEFHGRRTANGEVFDRNAMTAAHPTLPMPVNVRVTNLENGKSIVVRVNDRGPFAKGRVIDLSERAADVLGYRLQGTARVRVSYLGRADRPTMFAENSQTPPEIASAIPAVPSGQVATASLAFVPGAAAAAAKPIAALPQPGALPPATPPAAPDGRVTAMQVPASTSLYVQAGAFSSIDNAYRVAATLKSYGAQIAPVVKNGETIYRIRLGPYQNVDAADGALARVQGLGHNDARIVVD